ncbi:MAG TPA: TonB-dependent receptor, partial [Aquabacterium sp.]|nr:TonB-dependent receptor [Aquabacterium sp.]
ERDWGTWLAQIDLGRRERDSSYRYVSWGADLTSASSLQTQVSPRLVHRADLGQVKAVTVLGHERQHWTFDKNVANGQETARQENTAWFVHSDLAVASGTRVMLGWREERVTKKGDYPGAGYDSPVQYARRDVVRGRELGVNQTLAKGWDLYGRVAASYRLPNVDENRLTPSLGPLRPQRNQDKELGLKWAQGRDAATLRWFTQSTVDEIAFVGGMVFANANIDPTRRRGVELEGRWSPVTALTLSATWQQLSAKYRSGPQAGKEMVLVAPRTATVRAAYQFNAQHSVDVGVQYAASMRFGQDTNNQCGRRIPESTLLDARYAWTAQGWTVAVSGTNLSDEQGYNYAYSCAGGDVYPFAGRAIKLAVTRQF